MSFALEFCAVSKTFRKFFRPSRSVQALRNVSFTVNEGEVFGFVGPNGAGKSTTIKVMLDIIDDYQGEVRLYGVSARHAAARRGVAYLPESPALYEQFTPLELLRMALAMYGIRRDDRDAWCRRWLERFSVAHVAQQRLRQLSKGTVQRVALAHALVVSPRLLVLDEPLSGLDPVGRKDVVEILAEYKRDGGAIFLTSHVLHDVERIADRFGFIHRGELLTTRAPHELIAERADRYVVRYQSAQPVSAEATIVRPGEFEQELAQADLPAFLAGLQQSASRIVTVKPAVSLETVFFQILEGALAPAEPASQGVAPRP
jgi:ABC-2 type transport system ATP-binding protein